MRVAISGSRGPGHNRPIGWTDFDLIHMTVRRLLEQGHTINVGDAKSGVDAMVLEVHETAPDVADYFPSSSLKVYEARWDKEGRAAGHNRNAWMISESDMLIAFFAPTIPLTRGTEDAVQCAMKANIPVHIYFAPLGGWMTTLPKGV